MQGDAESELEALKQIFPQMEDRLLSARLREEGDFQSTVHSLLQSTEGQGKALQIENDEQIAMALQAQQGFSLPWQGEQWLASQNELWEGVKSFATTITSYVSDQYTSLVDNVQQSIEDPSDEAEHAITRLHSIDAVPDIQPHRESKKEQ